MRWFSFVLACKRMSKQGNYRISTRILLRVSKLFRKI